MKIIEDFSRLGLHDSVFFVALCCRRSKRRPGNEAIFDQEHGRIEMYLICTVAHTVHIGQTRISFRQDERICTEYSYKYDVEQLPALAATAGLRLERTWLDERRWFAVQYFSLP